MPDKLKFIFLFPQIYFLHYTDFMKRFSIFRFFKVSSACIAVFLFIITASPLMSQDAPISLAVFPFENMNGNPDQDYLKGIITYLLVGDLSRSGDIMIVERENIEEVFKEQKLQLTGLLNETGAIKAGKLLGASYILKGGYVFLGQDLFINTTLIYVETGGSRTFSERGYQENTVHALSEKLLKYLTGSSDSLQNPAGERSILALKQQMPGTVELYSYIIDARVYIDDAFVGYTTGDPTVPLILEVSPGKHIIRTHLTNNFGVIDTPAVVFHDWQEPFNLLPKEKITLEDRTRHFNDLLYKMKQLLREDISITPGKAESKHISHSLEFTDREGDVIKIDISLDLEETDNPEKGENAVILLQYQEKPYHFTYFAPSGKHLEFSEEVGKIKLNFGLDCSSGYHWDLDYSIWRTDIHQGMHRE